jgi:hypothetical protein
LQNFKQGIDFERKLKTEEYKPKYDFSLKPKEEISNTTSTTITSSNTASKSNNLNKYIIYL